MVYGVTRLGHDWATNHTRLVIAFLPRSKCLLISWLQSPSVMILEPKKMMSVAVSIVFPSICHEVMGPDAMILVFWMLSFKPTSSLSSFTFIKRLFSSSISAIRVVSSVCLRFLIFLPEILIPACASSNPEFLRMYSLPSFHPPNTLHGHLHFPKAPVGGSGHQAWEIIILFYFYYFSFIFISWRLITLQIVVVFAIHWQFFFKK